MKEHERGAGRTCQAGEGGKQSAIWKFPLQHAALQAVTMPAGARVLAVQLQHGAPALWALVDPAQPTTLRAFRIVGTGHPFEAEGLQYVGTFQTAHGEFVGHVFEVRP